MKSSNAIAATMIAAVLLAGGCAALDRRPLLDTIKTANARIAALEESGADTSLIAAWRDKAIAAESALEESGPGLAGVLDAASTLVAPVGPWGTIGALALTTLGAWVRGNRKGRDLDSLGKAVARVAMNNDGIINTKDKATKETLDLIMTPAASSVVRRHLGKNV